MPGPRVPSNTGKRLQTYLTARNPRAATNTVLKLLSGNHLTLNDLHLRSALTAKNPRARKGSWAALVNEESPQFTNLQIVRFLLTKQTLGTKFNEEARVVLGKLIADETLRAAVTAKNPRARKNNFRKVSRDGYTPVDLAETHDILGVLAVVEWADQLLAGQAFRKLFPGQPLPVKQALPAPPKIQPKPEPKPTPTPPPATPTPEPAPDREAMAPPPPPKAAAPTKTLTFGVKTPPRPIIYLPTREKLDQEIDGLRATLSPLMKRARGQVKVDVESAKTQVKALNAECLSLSTKFGMGISYVKNLDTSANTPAALQIIISTFKAAIEILNEYGPKYGKLDDRQKATLNSLLPQLIEKKQIQNQIAQYKALHEAKPALPPKVSAATDPNEIEWGRDSDATIVPTPIVMAGEPAKAPAVEPIVDELTPRVLLADKINNFENKTPSPDECQERLDQYIQVLESVDLTPELLSGIFTPEMIVEVFPLVKLEAVRYVFEAVENEATFVQVKQVLARGIQDQKDRGLLRSCLTDVIIQSMEVDENASS